MPLKPLSFTARGELSLTEALALSKICRVQQPVAPKVRRRAEDTKLRFASEDQNETHELDLCDENMKEQIWYNVSRYC